MNATKGRPWKKGQSGNPAGRPPGARHRTTVMLEKLMAADSENIVRTVLAAAAQGDMTAARMVLDRVVPPVKERPIALDLPSLDGIESIAEAHSRIVAAVAAGELLPSEGQALAGLLESRLRVAEVADLERRIAELEGQPEGAS